MSIQNMKKHAGILSNTGVRVAVIFRKIPGDEKNCLIVETEHLLDSYHDYLIQTLNSKEAMETNDFFEVLQRRTFPDGLNCLTALHTRGFLRKEAVANVTMIPLPGQNVPLALINATIDKTVDEYTKEQAALTKPLVDPTANPVDVAKGLILQAELLEKDAAKHREEAYALAPELKPTVGRPADPEEVKAAKLEERKKKRLERDRVRAAEAKADKIESDMDAKIAAKLERDAVRNSKPKLEMPVEIDDGVEEA